MGALRAVMTTGMCGLLSILILLGCGKSGQEERANSNQPSKTNQAANEPGIKVIDWGPQDTEQGVAFNVQPDGRSAMWIQVSGVANSPDTQILFGTQPITEVVVQEKLVTFPVPNDYFTEAGTKEVKIREGSLNRTTLVGQFTIKPRKSK